jgi:hypothetical protein
MYKNNRERKREREKERKTGGGITASREGKSGNPPRLRFTQHAYVHKKAKPSGKAERSGKGGFGVILRLQYNTTRPRA